MRLLALHPLAYEITARPACIARATASALARRIARDPSSGPAVTVLVGHDTNQAELGGLLGLHWHLGGYPADDPPPGGGILFSRLRARDGAQYVTAQYQAATPGQIRTLAPFSPSNPPALQPLPIPGCGNSVKPTACTLQVFEQLVDKVAE